MKILYAFSLAVFVTANPLLAAPPDDSGRGSPAPGTAEDGSRPADGAIKGGAMLPGESAGIPSPSGAPAETVSKSCGDLAGTLRAECVARQRDASRGASRPPEVINPRADPTAPPPQNPR
ncbi:MAG TPA: hypothetical protein VI321_01670 [Burkholderiales bacterium]